MFYQKLMLLKVDQHQLNKWAYKQWLGTASKPNRWLTGGSVRFRPVSIVLNKDNRPEPDGTAGQPAVGF